MRGESAPDRAIAALAARQGGAVSRAQLLALGLSAKTVDRRLQAGRLHAVHRGAYAVGHPLLGVEASPSAAAPDAGAELASASTDRRHCRPPR